MLLKKAMNKNLGLDFYLLYFLKGWKEKFFCSQPIFITFFITSRCNARCYHCFYWDRLENNDQELSLEEIEKISFSIGPFPKLLLSGGEPFLRDDIDEICRIFYSHNRVKQITIPTNGILSDKIYEKTKNILTSCPNVNMQVQISIDGPKEVHNSMRKVPNAFDSMIKTYHLLKHLEREYKHFEINFCFTFSSLNQDYVQDAYDCVRELGNDSFHILLVRSPVEDRRLLEFDFEKYDKWNKFLLNAAVSKKSNISENMFIVRRRQQLRIIKDVIKDEKFTFKCTAGMLTAVIDELGMVHPCETSKTVFGSLRDNDYNFHRVWHGNAASLFRNTAVSQGCRCTHESNTITNISFSVLSYLNLPADYLLGRII